MMGHSDISVTINTYMYLELEDAVEEMGRMQGNAGGESFFCKNPENMLSLEPGNPSGFTKKV